MIYNIVGQDSSSYYFTVEFYLENDFIKTYCRLSFVSLEVKGMTIWLYSNMSKVENWSYIVIYVPNVPLNGGEITPCREQHFMEINNYFGIKIQSWNVFTNLQMCKILQ